MLFQIGNEPFLPAAGTTNWSAAAMVQQGVNSFRVKAIDFAGNESELAESSLYFLASPLALTVDGAGTVRPLTNGQPLVLGKRYTLTAAPRPGNLFSHWSEHFLQPVPHSASLPCPTPH